MTIKSTKETRHDYMDDLDIPPAWHLHDGFMRLFIVGGRGHHQGWFPVTAPDSSKSRHGTNEERSIAEKAVEWLRHNRRDDADAGPAEIRSALETFGWTPDDLTRYAC